MDLKKASGVQTIIIAVEKFKNIKLRCKGHQWDKVIGDVSNGTVERKTVTRSYQAR